MLCPHCGHDNVAGRKYCRSCTKPLTGEATALKPAPVTPLSPEHLATPASAPPSASAPAPATNKMAIASLALSFLAFIVPLGIASVVMGHISRRQIAKSNGRETGNWFAFAGLILGYLQLAVVAVLALVFVGLVLEMNQKLGRDPYMRAALVERLMNGDPRHPSAAVVAEHRRNVLDALRLIRAREDSYQQAHSASYACSVNDLVKDDPELNQHMIQSHYQVQIFCREIDPQTAVARAYVVTAIARSANNPPDSPSYCLDSTGAIRQYSFGEASDGMVNRTFIGREPCPDDGEAIE